MIDVRYYLKTVEDYFQFLLNEFGYELDEIKVNGNFFYDVRYKSGSKIISISYENIEDYFQVTIFILENGKLPFYDDKLKILNLNRLNNYLLPTISSLEMLQNSKYFNSFSTDGTLERKILKSAKELRLVLNHFETLFNFIQK